MKTTARTAALSIIVLASLCGCGTVVSVASTAADYTISGVSKLASMVMPSKKEKAEKAEPAPVSPSLEAYKAQVAQHVVQHNPDHTFSGKLPEMLPAIVVLNITVDKDGELKDVVVQRSRDEEASKMAVESMKRSGPLPKPVNVVAAGGGPVTFSETFLFDSQYRFQLRSLAGPQ